jgi:SAM-dependent methyltransferase
MSAPALYTDLSAYYDLLCADINYCEQSHHTHRLHQLFGNKGKHYLDLACGTGPHLRHFIDAGYQTSGIDLNPAMLALAQQRCPEAQLSQQDISQFSVDQPLDLITCFLYSIHYNSSIDKLRHCIKSVHTALNPEGVFCFNAVDKDQIDPQSFTRHSVQHQGSTFTFTSRWHYPGKGDQQALHLRIDKTHEKTTQTWHDQHPMVAIQFQALEKILQLYFDVHIFEHDYSKIQPWAQHSGNAIFVCIKK